MKILDLFCGAGGAAMGYFRAGFEVTGVDINKQPRYPFDFHHGDAIEFCLEHGHKFDLIHASPPCQLHSVLKSTLSTQQLSKHKDLISPTRQAILKTGKYYVIENVYGARRHLINPVMLCGKYFGLKVYRHRLFECQPWLMSPPHVPHHDDLQGCGRGLSSKGFISVTGDGGDASLGKNFFPYACNAMGIDWMNRRELSQAIPPAYTEWIGRQMLAQIERRLA